MTNISTPAASEILCTILPVKQPGFAHTSARVPLKNVHKNWTIISIDGAEVYQDGNQWCALIGNNLQDGVAGFGSTQSEAMHDLIAHLSQNNDAN